LRDELERLGLSMAEAARAIGEESSQGIRDVCSGRKRASAELVAKLSVAGVDVLYTLTGQRSNQLTEYSSAYQPPLSASMNQPTATVTAYLNYEEAALLDNYRNSPPDGQAAIKATSAALAQSAKVLKKGKAA
jgi:plasmid maintenance system antidote protein VapI